MNHVFSLGCAQSPGEIPELLRLHGWNIVSLCPMEVRDRFSCYHRSPSLQNFHKDGICRNGQYFAVWTSTGGTSVRFPTETGHRIVIASPRELLVIDNNACDHRAPAVIEDHRIFARISGVKRMKGDS